MKAHDECLGPLRVDKKREIEKGRETESSSRMCVFESGEINASVCTVEVEPNSGCCLGNSSSAYWRIGERSMDLERSMYTYI